MKQIECKINNTIISQTAIIYHKFNNGDEFAFTKYYDHRIDIFYGRMWYKFEKDKYFSNNLLERKIPIKQIRQNLELVKKIKDVNDSIVIAEHNRLILKKQIGIKYETN